MASQKVTLNDEEIFSLIKEYEQHECLWKKSHKDYKNNFKKIDAYKAIGFLLNISEDLVKEKCRSLRTVYFQNVQKAKKGKSGSGGGKAPVWKFYGALSFLQSEAADCGSIDTLDLNTSVMNWMNKCDNACFNDRKFSFHSSQNTEATEGDSDTTTIALEIDRPSSSLSQMSQTSVVSQTSSNSGTPTNLSASKKRRAQYEEERRERWDTLMSSIRPQNAHEEFGHYVSSSLAQINNDNLVKATKSRIQLILAKALAEYAESQLTSNVQQVVIYEPDGSISSADIIEQNFDDVQ